MGGGWWHFLAGLSDLWLLRNFMGLWLILGGLSLGFFSLPLLTFAFPPLGHFYIIIVQNWYIHKYIQK